MSTHASISVEKEDGSIHSIYLHMDGGLKAQNMLMKHYTDMNKVS